MRSNDDAIRVISTSSKYRNYGQVIELANVTGLQTALDAKLNKALSDGRIFVGNASNEATGVSLSGEASITNAGVITLSTAAVIGKAITGYVSGAGTVAATDTLLQAIQKLNGNIGLKQNALVSGTYATMIALTPSEGDEFFLTDYLRGLWRYRWGTWTYVEDWSFYQQWGTTTGVTFAAAGTPYTYMRGLASGASAAATVTLDTTGVTKHGAYVALTTGTTTTGGAWVDEFGGTTGGSRKVIRLFRFQIPTLASVAEDFYVSLGIDFNITSGATLVYNRANSTGNTHNWYAMVGTNINVATLGTTAGTKVDTGVVADTSWHTAAIVYWATQVEFYMDGVLMCPAITTTLPTAADRLFRGLSIRKSAGTTSRILNVDEVKGYI